MLPFKFCFNHATNERWIETSISGKALLNTPMLNKGTAFSYDERRTFGLLGKLPQRTETLDEQVERSYQQLMAYADDKFQQHIYLNNLHDRNETLFYHLLIEHLQELLPVIYTPIVGTAVQQHSREFRQPRGIYIAYPDRYHIEEILDNRSHPDISLIVATDGEGVLGIGDQGVGAIDIPIAKLVVYTLCGGLNPAYTLPIMLDVGTNNEELLADPYYLGWQHKRISREEYDEFIGLFVAAIKKKFPNVFLHWEDLGRDNAHRLLQQYQNELCTFNDDIQGTGAVALAGLLSAVKVSNIPLTEQRIVIFGAGSAGMGIADQIASALLRSGLSSTQVYEHFWLVDRNGLLLNTMTELTPCQAPYARDPKEVEHLPRNAQGQIELLTVIKHVQPHVLIGCSTVFGAFDQTLVQTMASFCERPIIFPMSNPTERAEADPKDLLAWTQGKALVAAGSPFDNLDEQGATVQVAQCNNALIFPAIGLGVLACKATQLTENMIWAACQELAAAAPIHTDIKAPILPPVSQVRELRIAIAGAVIRQAWKDGVSQYGMSSSIEELCNEISWEPYYLPLRKWIE
jgi:malate dehydrogenase (oxaloacetate-decarboxylating)